MNQKITRRSACLDIRTRWSSIVDNAIDNGLRKTLRDSAIDALPKGDTFNLSRPNSSAKVDKGRKIGIDTLILYLSPAGEAVTSTLCEDSVPACRALCLGHSAGRMIMTPSKLARLWRTALWLGDREAFIRLLIMDLESLALSAKKRGHVTAFRFNGSTDIEVPDVIRSTCERLGVNGYGYTKSLARAMASVGTRYPLTFSFSGNVDRALVARDHGANVAMVFDTAVGQELPDAIVLGHEPVGVIDGDISDARFLDPKDADGRGLIVGLRFKKAKAIDKGLKQAIRSGWVVEADRVAF
jgi:hypothetical protein